MAVSNLTSTALSIASVLYGYLNKKDSWNWQYTLHNTQTYVCIRKPLSVLINETVVVLSRISPKTVDFMGKPVHGLRITAAK